MHIMTGMKNYSKTRSPHSFCYITIRNEMVRIVQGVSSRHKIMIKNIM